MAGIDHDPGPSQAERGAENKRDVEADHWLMIRKTERHALLPSGNEACATVEHRFHDCPALIEQILRRAGVRGVRRPKGDSHCVQEETL